MMMMMMMMMTMTMIIAKVMDIIVFLYNRKEQVNGQQCVPWNMVRLSLLLVSFILRYLYSFLYLALYKSALISAVILARSCSKTGHNISTAIFFSISLFFIV